LAIAILGPFDVAHFPKKIAPSPKNAKVMGKGSMD